MSKLRYKDITISDTKMVLISKANEIIAKYQTDGYDLTVRQLYYQFVARDLLPEEWADPATGSTNNTRSYKKLGDIISDGRIAGFIDWNAIRDRTREKGSNSHWDSPTDIVGACGQQFRLDTRADQPRYIEVWVEKDALEGVIERSCRELDVSWLSCRGYVSMSTLWEASQRFIAQERQDKETIILHLGDHDPSGIDMTRDMRERMEMFGSSVQIRRIALNMDQVEQYDPPPNPAKETDSRFARYREEFGDESWELDALEPQVLAQLISAHVRELRDEDKWDAQLEREEAMKATLEKAAKKMKKPARRSGNVGGEKP